MSNNPRLRASRVVAWASLATVPGAMAQAGNNVFASMVRTAFSKTDGVSAVQALTASLSLSFIAAALVGGGFWLAFRNTERGFNWAPPSLAAFWMHEFRLVVGLSATVLVFFAAQDGSVPIGVVTTLMSTGPIYLALRDVVTSRQWGSLAVAAVGFGGILIVSQRSIMTVQGFSLAFGAALVAGVLLACLQLIQSALVKTHRESPAKVVGIFGIQATVLSVIAFMAASSYTGVLPALSISTASASVGLMFCYGASQFLLQFANGFGDPAIVGVIQYLGIPFGLTVDFALGKPATFDQIVGGVVILAAAVLARLVESRRRTN